MLFFQSVVLFLFECIEEAVLQCQVKVLPHTITNILYCLLGFRASQLLCSLLAHFLQYFHHICLLGKGHEPRIAVVFFPIFCQHLLERGGNRYFHSTPNALQLFHSFFPPALLPFCWCYLCLSRCHLSTQSFLFFRCLLLFSLLFLLLFYSLFLKFSLCLFFYLLPLSVVLYYSILLHVFIHRFFEVAVVNAIQLLSISSLNYIQNLRIVVQVTAEDEHILSLFKFHF
mmetsp:Transcript_350/g.509  ORF Transcript_350/g.509 Transcript_350/m.509 type:complete len:228 (-) Transcript_350:23-706(-)